jgi:hypothetical protein
MRFFAVFLTGLFVFGAASFVYAADEFGARFNADAPAALESQEDEAAGLQDIEPAAGDSTDATTEAPADTSGETPAETTEAVESELEEKFDTEVSTTISDQGDGQIEQHDSVGDGKVRAFYKSETDSRVMDTNDAAGVEVKVLEFE